MYENFNVLYIFQILQTLKSLSEFGIFHTKPRNLIQIDTGILVNHRRNLRTTRNYVIFIERTIEKARIILTRISKLLNPFLDISDRDVVSFAKLRTRNAFFDMLFNNVGL
jgi:hypothetical protein